MIARPQFWIVAGPNGAGKSTLVRNNGKLAARLEVINPDDIAYRIDPLRRSEPAVLLRAGKEALQRRQALLSARKSFLIETTLTGQGALTLMSKAQASGFKVTLAYVGLPLAEMSASRVSERVRKGGHDVPDEDIRRRFGRSVANLPQSLAGGDRAYLFDNGGRRHTLVYAVEDGRVEYRANILPS